MDLTGVIINNRYRLARKISRGTFTDCYEAECPDKSDERYFVRVMQDSRIVANEDDVIKVRHDLRVISTINHPNILNVFDYGKIFGLPYIVMENVPGKNIFSYFKDHKPSIKQTLKIIRETVLALESLHEHRIFHKGLNPLKIHIAESDGSDGFTVKLKEIGYSHVWEIKEADKFPEGEQDYFEYLSPEQIALKHSLVDQSSDLYSVGILFFELTTGRLPFTADQIIVAVSSGTELKPELPSSINPELDEFLDYIILKLINHDKEERYQSTTELLSDIDNYQTNDWNLFHGKIEKGLRAGYHAKFTGRNDEQDTLINSYKISRRGDGRISIISGESGIGKTRLIDEFLAAIKFSNSVILYGKCKIRNKEPFRLIRELLNSYIEIYSDYNEDRKEHIRESLRDTLGILGEIILKLNPEMIKVIGNFPGLVKIYPDTENERFYSITSEFFINLSRLEKHLVLVVDNLQWIDDGSLQILKRISSAISRTPIFLVTSIRNNGLEKREDVLNFINIPSGDYTCIDRLNMGRFNPAETREFISSIVYDNNTFIDELAGYIHSKSGGQPLFAIEILKKLIDEKILIHKSSGWYYDRSTLENSIIPLSTTDLIYRRISQLPEIEINILKHVSEMGSSFSFETLTMLFKDIDRNHLQRYINRFVDLQLLTSDSTKNGYYSFAHERVQEALSIYISSEEKRSINYRIATAIETINNQDTDTVLFDLANHYIESGDDEKILEYAYRASFKASEDFANNDSMRYFSTVLKILNKKLVTSNNDPKDVWLYAQKGLAKVYLRIGRYDDAINILNELVPYTEDDTTRALSQSMISLAYFKKGDWKLCEVYAKIGVNELGWDIPMGKNRVILALIHEIIRHILHIILPFIFQKKGAIPENSRAELVVMFYETLFFLYGIKNHLKYLWVTFRFLNDVERHIGSGSQMVKALYSYGMMLMALPSFRHAMKYLRKSASLAEELNDPYLIAMTNFYIGSCFDWQGDYNNAIIKYMESLEQFYRIGNSNASGFVQNALCCSYLQKSDYSILISAAEKYYDLAVTTSNSFFICNAIIFKVFYYIGVGDFDMALIHARKVLSISSESNLLMQLCISYYLTGMIYFYLEDFSTANEHYSKSVELYDIYRFLKYFTYTSYPLYAESLIEEYRHSKNLTIEQRKILLNKIKKYTFLSLKSTTCWVTIYKCSLLTTAKYYALIGKNKKAEKYFLKSIQTCTDYGFKYDLVKTLYDYGCFLNDRGECSKSMMEHELAYHLSKEIGAAYFTEKISKLLGIKKDHEVPSAIQHVVQIKKNLLIKNLVSEINMNTAPENIFSEIMKNARILSGASGSAIFTTDDHNLIIAASTSNIEEDCMEGLINNSSEVFKSATPMTGNISGEAEGCILSGELFLNLPVIYSGSVIAVCSLMSPAGGHLFTEENISLLSMFLEKSAHAVNYACEYMRSNSDKNASRHRISSTNEDKIRKVISYIDENYMFNISREGLASLVDSNPDYFGKIFKTYTGMKINEFINKRRIEEAAERLTNSESKIIDIALSVGFENLSTFNKSFSRLMNTKPSRYRSSTRK